MDEHTEPEPQPSTSSGQASSTQPDDGTSSTDNTQALEKELSEDKELGRVLTVEEFLMKSKTYMLEYEKHMFLDTIDSDCLVVSAK